MRWTKQADAVLDAIEAADGGDWIGDCDKARLLIALLIDQAGYSLNTQNKVAELLNLPNLTEVK